MPNKVTSKSQFRLLKGISEGDIPERGALTKKVAAEMVEGQTPQGLPEKVKVKALNRLVSRVKRAKGRFRIGGR